VDRSIVKGNIMPSVYELAKICQASYSYQPQVDGWETLQPVYNFLSNKGFFAAMLRKDDEYVMVFRGTDDATNDMISNASLSLGFSPQQYYSANMALTMALKKYGSASGTLTLTGHSLGGGLAALVSAREHKIPVVTFNSPGMYRAATLSGLGGDLPGMSFGKVVSLVNHFRDRNGIRSYIDNFKKVLHIRSEYDLVSIGTGRKITGRNVTLENPFCPKPEGKLVIDFASQAAARSLCVHSIDKLEMVIRGIPEFHEEIDWS
jgi:hypothetical protein